MKIRNKYHKTIGFFLMAFALTIIATFSYATTNMDVTVEEIYFNYENGNTDDALTISNDGTPIVNDAEWHSYYGETHKFAYIKGQSNRKIKVRFNAGSYSGVMHLLIKVSYGYYDDGIGTICNLFIPNFDIGANDTQIFTLNGTLPNSVGVHQFDWEWEIYAIPVNNSNYCAAWSTTYTSHHFYTLLAAPQAPMAQPWERVLDYACTWANGKDDAESVCSDILNNGFSLHYTWAWNCDKLSSDFVRLVSSLGITAVQHKWSATGAYVGDMFSQKTKSIEPVGSSGQGVYVFSFHQWAEAASAQRDPTTNTSFLGSWGEYEDNLYTHYNRLISVYPHTYVPDLNQPGQTSGCEAPGHSLYSFNSISILYEWKGPDR